MPVHRFTLIGATTRTGLLTSPLRARFGIVHRLDYYSDGDVEEIVRRSARMPTSNPSRARSGSAAPSSQSDGREASDDH